MFLEVYSNKAHIWENVFNVVQLFYLKIIIIVWLPLVEEMSGYRVGNNFRVAGQPLISW